MPKAVSLGAVGEFAASRHGAFTRSQAAENGLGHSAVGRLIRRGVLEEPAPGVLLISGAPATFEQRAYIATLANAGRGLVIAGAAARIHGVDGCTDHDHPMVAVPRGGRMTVPGVDAVQRREWYGDDDVIMIGHLRCSTLARTVVDLAHFHPDLYERAADDFQRRGHSLLWLQQTLDRVPRRRADGLELAYADLERRLRGGTVRGSWFERLAEACVTSPRIPPVVRQFEIRDDDGAFVARPDLAIPSLRLAIEAHSRKHHTGPRAEAFDEQREHRMAIEGWHTSYIGWTATNAEPEVVRRTIERIVARRARDLGVDLTALVSR